MVSGTKEKPGRIRSPRKLIIIAALLVVGLVAVWELIQYHVFDGFFKTCEPEIYFEKGIDVFRESKEEPIASRPGALNAPSLGWVSAECFERASGFLEAKVYEYQGPLKGQTTLGLNSGIIQFKGEAEETLRLENFQFNADGECSVVEEAFMFSHSCFCDNIRMTPAQAALPAVQLPEESDSLGSFPFR